MSNSYVGVASTPLDASKLKDLISRCISNGWLFLRWPHKVHLSPMDSSLAVQDLLCQEGQAFNQSRELRWRRKGNAYEVLLLSDSGGDDMFSSLGSVWETKVLDAKTYPETETRFPREVTIPKELDLGQRYFIDVETACVQFIALRVK